MSNRAKIVLLLVFLFAFRTLFGLSMTFFGANEIENDALQTYLIGLKSYTTGTWPYFGPDQYDLATGSQSQIPGALEGLAIGLPFRLWPVPEAPFLLLNLLSLSALGFLAWWISRRLPAMSFPFALAWVSLLPWTLDRSTHVFNPSYLLFGSVLFWIGFLEMVPELSLKRIPAFGSSALMGFGLAWDMQFHGSWVLLPVFAAGVFLWRRKRGMDGASLEACGFAVGAAPLLALLVPTLLQFGIHRGAEGFLRVAVPFNRGNFEYFPVILARFLSLACYEMPRFLGSGTAEREAFFRGYLWLAPPALFLTLAGWVQPFILLVYGWFRDPRVPGSRTVQVLVFLGLFWTWFCFWFTTTGPAAHMYYVFLPLILTGSLFVWERLGRRKGWRMIGLACLGASLWFHSGFIVRQLSQGGSLYEDRARIVRALDRRDHRILAERRQGSLY